MASLTSSFDFGGFSSAAVEKDETIIIDIQTVRVFFIILPFKMLLLMHFFIRSMLTKTVLFRPIFVLVYSFLQTADFFDE